MCFRWLPIVGDDHGADSAGGGLGSTETGDSDSHASPDEDGVWDDSAAAAAAATAARQPRSVAAAVKVGDGTSCSGLPTSSYHTIIIIIITDMFKVA